MNDPDVSDPASPSSPSAEELARLGVDPAEFRAAVESVVARVNDQVGPMLEQARQMHATDARIVADAYEWARWRTDEGAEPVVVLSEFAGWLDGCALADAAATDRLTTAMWDAIESATRGEPAPPLPPIYTPDDFRPPTADDPFPWLRQDLADAANGLEGPGGMP